MSVVPQCPPVPAPTSLGSGLFDSWLEGCAATLDGLGKCWTAALQRGPTAFEIARSSASLRKAAWAA